MKEAELNAEAARAGGYYAETKCRDLPLAQRTPIVNNVARGFAMGVRWKERELGVKGGPDVKR